LVDAGLSVTAVDDSGENPTVNVRVYGNEGDRSASDPPADAFPAHSFRGDRLPLLLRAQRDDEGGGRFYLVVIRATDGSGNTGFACRAVVVPHDNSRASTERVNRLAAEALAGCGPLGSPLAPFRVGDPANAQPQVAADAYTTDEDTALDVPPLGSLRNDEDAEGEPLTASLVSGPAHGSLTFKPNGSFSYVPDLNFYGTDSFSYKAKDDERESAVAVVALTINPVNDAPVAGGDSYSLSQDAPLTVAAPGLLVNDGDVENSPLTAAVSGPAHGTLALDPSGSLVYTPHAEFVGTDSFTYRANDGELDSAPATVILTVRPATLSFGNTEVIAAGEALEQDGRVKRVQIIKADFKYPFIRVEERLTRDPGSGAESVEPQAVAMAADHVIAKLRPGRTREELETAASAFGLTVLKAMRAPDTYLVQSPAPELNAVEEAVGALSQSGIISYAEPDYIVRVTAGGIPDDTGFSFQWGMHNTGQFGGRPDADIDAPAAWRLGTGSWGVKVGMIDTGIDYTHPDLEPNIWTNPFDVPDGRDNDANGLVDDVHGWDFYNDDSDPRDDHGHGTHTAGTVGAFGNNGTGVAGVNWLVSMAAIKFMTPLPNGSAAGPTSDAVDAIRYATSIGMSVTSNSWGGYSHPPDQVQSLREAIAEANQRGVLFVAAAGNDGNDNDSRPVYPASIDLPNVISVAASGHSDDLVFLKRQCARRLWSSNFGANSVDLAAPGIEIWSTSPPYLDGLGLLYKCGDGTSMATPHVAGACALLKAREPGLSHLEIKNRILARVDLKPWLGGKLLTGGRLNLYKTLNAADPLPQIVTFHMDDPAGPNNGYFRTGTLNPNSVVTGWSEVTRIPGHWGDVADHGGITNADINGNGIPDLVVLHVDDPAGENIGWYKIGWDFELGTLNGVWTEVRNIPGHWGHSGDGADIAAADLNNNGRLDLVAFSIDDPAGPNFGWYKIGWDLDQNGHITGGWDPIKHIPGHWGDRDDGGGFAIGDLNGNGRPEFVTFHIDEPAGPNFGFYRIGWDVDTAGNVTGGWDPVVQIPGHWGDATEDGGIAIFDVNNNGRPDFVVLHVDDPERANNGYYRVGWDVDAAGNVTGGWTPVSTIPGHWGDAVDGSGVTVVGVQ
jgi:subtilisin family serine protease